MIGPVFDNLVRDVQILRDAMTEPACARRRRLAQRIAAARDQAALSAEFRTLTPTQAADWIETNVTNLATAKSALKIMARILIALRDHTWPDLPE